MASAGASSRKQKDLEAGRKRLEEFRKRKADKKLAVSEQGGAAPTNLAVKQSPDDTDSLNVHPSVSDTSSTSTHVPVGIYHNGPIISSESNHLSNGPSGPLSVQSTSDQRLHEATSQYANNEELNWSSETTGFLSLANGYHEKEPTVGSTIDHSNDFSSVRGMLSQSRESSVPVVTDSDYSSANNKHNLIEKDTGSSVQGISRSLGIFSSTSAPEDSSQPEATKRVSDSLNYGGKMIAEAIGNHRHVASDPWQPSRPFGADVDMTLQKPRRDGYIASTSQQSTFRSQISFLDLIGAQKASIFDLRNDEAGRIVSAPASENLASDSSLHQQLSPYIGNDANDKSSTSGVQGSGQQKDLLTSTSTLATVHGPDQINATLGFHSQGKDDDFSALEQLIEDLTQEKFSLQRALDTSRTLAETLAADNSSLTDKFNDQGQTITQLRSEMERLQEEIIAQLRDLESVKLEYANAQLECSAADERAKVLASEVIILEEKALRLRSNELKLEKQLETLNSDMASYRKKVSSLEKERQDFQSTIEALQEERKILQLKLRKGANERATETGKSPSNRVDASTSTADLVAESFADVSWTTHSHSFDRGDDVGTSALSDSASGHLLLEEALGIPEDQIRSIENINSLISELAIEREELTRALRIESSNCSKLKELNKDLTHKLEVQTQRFELMAAQRMANEHVLSKPVEAISNNDMALYADEGDEVVERVLGWIMRLFPGGPKRRTSKLL